MKSPKKRSKSGRTKTAEVKAPLAPETRVISHIPLDNKAQVGKPQKKSHIASAGMGMKSRYKGESIREQVSSHMKVAAACGAGMGTGGGFGGAGGLGGGFVGGGGLTGGGYGSGTNMSSGQNWYSPELSTDFLQLPQSLVEFWNYYRFFYNNEPFVGRAVDLHTFIPLSKTRISFPNSYKDKELAKKAQRFCQKWAKRVGLEERLREILHNFNLFGEANLWCEDSIGAIPDDVQYQVTVTLQENGDLVEEYEEREDANERLVEWMKKNYTGWKKVRILAPEHVHVESVPGASQELVMLLPDAKLKSIIDMAIGGDEHAERVVNSMDPELINKISSNEKIFLNTDPYLGSFYTAMRNTKDGVETRGHSILQRCLRVLVHYDLLRQAQNQIASRHMTPVRLIYAEGMDIADTEELRDQIDLALQDPDYSIITNFQVTWEELNSNGRLLELSGEYDLITRQLYAGLGVTESLLSGESSYSGDIINLEVLNIIYLDARMRLQRLVEEHLFKPMCAKMGFVEEDEDGDLQVIYPGLSFTRIALRNNQDVFTVLFDLYQKGSLDIETLYDTLNLDYEEVQERLKRDMMTLSDPNFNEVMRGMYGGVGNSLPEKTDLMEKIAKYLGLKIKPESGGDRFG